ncbi:t1pks [Neopestalotiopsis sp. 37M]|nr:t1pks [Neopestalotiopsis sp. 37M]
MEQPKTMPIAITGLACRFPGGADTPERLWEVCAAARNTWSSWPQDRLNEKAFTHPQAEHLGTFHSHGGHFLNEDVSLWDASFFNFTADMAKAMDPQVRLLLETAFEAFQTAGLSLEKVAGTQTAVFAGSMFRDYHDLLMKDAESLPRYHVTGNAAAFTANRLSHFFDLRGPSVSVDTACSTALAALHLACQSIRTGESKMAVVGGSNLILHPGSSMSLSNLGLTGPGGKSFSFDERAQGYGRGEGVACIVLKPLEDAIRDGDPIRAVIRETGVNQDGRTQTITTPSPEAQRQLITSCYERAGLNPRDTTYVEAHGTGTIAGDKIELGALGATIGKGRGADDSVYVGSVKANFGHTESTSGLAAVIKVAMMLEHGKIPPQALFQKHNPRIDFEALNIKIPTELLDWPECTVRRASISNFGAGGANTHVILEEPNHLIRQYSLRNGETTPVSVESHDQFQIFEQPVLHEELPSRTSEDIHRPFEATDGTPPQTPPRTPPQDRGSKEITQIQTRLQEINGTSNIDPNQTYIFPLSARDESSLRTAASKLADSLASPGSTWTLPNLAYTLSEGRTHFPWRLAVQSSSLSALRETLINELPKPISCPQRPKIGFVFTGQGAQWFAMGRELINFYPAFNEALREGGVYMRSLGADWDPIEELGRSASDTKLNYPYLSFPMSVLLQLALVRLLKTWGIVPMATTGHSSGEIAAAYASGGLSFKEAVAVAYIRGRLTSDFVEAGRARGGMTAVATSKENAREIFKAAQLGDSAVIACVNSPNSVTISGNIASLEKVEELAGKDNLMFRRLKVPAAYHSSEMEALSEDYTNALKPHFEPEHPQAFAATFSSPVTGGIVESPSVIHDPSHWVRNMVQPVLFDDSLKAMVVGSQVTKGKTAVSQVDVIIEIGPHGTLQGPIRQIIDGVGLQTMKSNLGTCLKRGEDAVKTMKDMAIMLHCRGYPVNLAEVNCLVQSQPLRVLHDLPTYVWNHSSSYWDVPKVAIDYMQRKHPRHDLLGVRVEGLNPEQAIWRNTIRISDLPWLQHHVVQSEILYPAAGLLVMVTEAMRQLDDEKSESSSGYTMSDVDLSTAVIISDSGEPLEIQLVIKEQSPSDAGREFVFYSRSRSGSWVKHCRGKVAASQHLTQSALAGGLDLVPMDLGHFYKFVERTGPTLGPTFRNVKRLSGGALSAEASITIPDIVAISPSSFASSCLIHPTTLDACFHPAWAALPNELLGKIGLSVPRTITNLFIDANIPDSPGTELGLRVSMENASPETFTVSITVYSLLDADRKPLIKIDGLTMVSIAESASPPPSDELMLLHTDWKPTLSFLSADDLRARIFEEPPVAEAIFFDDLQRATVNVIHDALEELTPDVEENLEWYHRKYVQWMREQSDEFYTSMEVKDQTEKLHLYERMATSSCVNGRMLDLVARNLSSFLTKQADPLEVMAKDGFLSEYYANMIKLERCLRHIEKYMELFAHENPGARILEIGAGTGSCTEAALMGLSQGGRVPLMAEKYVFTDVSAGFFEAAGKRFENFASKMHFQKLDIEREPAEQGFVEGEYDLIISCNCLHATSDLTNTLRNARKLLRAGGKLVLLETTTPHLDQSLTFGLFSGWWLSKEDERKNSPLLSALAWGRYLSEAGFNGLDVALGDAGGAEISNYSAMVATAEEVTPTTNGDLRSKRVILAPFPLRKQLPKEWLDQLRDAVAATTDATVTIAQGVEDLKKEAAFVCLLAADEESLVSMTPSDFDTLKNITLEHERILWVSQGAFVEAQHTAAGLHAGLLRTLRLEQGADRYVSLDLDPARPYCSQEHIEVIRTVFESTYNGRSNKECELAERNSNILVPRLLKSQLVSQAVEIEEPALQLDPNAGYVIIGGLTGVGREVVRWLARMGAKNLIVISRNTNLSNAKELANELAEAGAKLIPFGCDIADMGDLERFIGALRVIMPIRGLIQSALVLEDASFASMTSDQWAIPLGPKYHGSRNLVELLSSPDLDFLVMLSSVTGVLGSHGQSNYTAGSTYQDALARSRVAQGLPGVSIDLGAVLGAGYVARTDGVVERTGKAGWRAHTVQEVLRLVELAIRNPMQAEIVAGISPWSISDTEQLSWRGEGRFMALPQRLETSRKNENATNTASLRERLQSSESKIDTMVEGLTLRLADMFVLSPSDIQQNQPLSALGVDSLVAVELRNWLSANVTPSITIFDVTQSGSLIELAEKVLAKFA